jgi:lipopolysaccharide biosynthesis glycosyltransferase
LFKERGFQRHIYIDADMLCLKPLDEDLLSAPFTAKAVREYGASIFPTRKEQKRDSFPDRALQYVEEHGTPRAAEIVGINSGLLVLERAALRDELFEAAISVGREGAFPSEQALTTEVIRQQQLSYLRLPLWYNARRRIFASLGEEFFQEVRDRIVLLHYTPGKPWKMSDAEVRVWDRLWLDCEERSRAWVKQVSSRLKS